MVKSWKIFLESTQELDVNYLKNVFSDLEDEFELRCIQSDVVDAKSVLSYENANELRVPLNVGLYGKGSNSDSGKFCFKKIDRVDAQGYLYVKRDTLLLRYHESYGWDGDCKREPPPKEVEDTIEEYVKDMKEFLEDEGYLVETRCYYGPKGEFEGRLMSQTFIMIVIQKS